MDKACDEWRKREDVNPQTGRKIKIGGPVHKRLKKQCEVPEYVRSRICDMWRFDPLVNPRTMRSIARDGKVYKSLERECDGVMVPETNPVADLPFMFTRAQCTEWKQNMVVHPKTLQKVKYGSKDFKLLQDECRVKFPREPLQPIKTYLDDRFKIETQIVAALKKIDSYKWDKCLSTDYSKFKEGLSNVVMLGRGSFGEVYKAMVGKNSVVIKESYFTSNEYADLIETGKFTKRDYPNEYKVAMLARKLMVNNAAPNFVLAYHIDVCTNCSITAAGEATGACHVTFMEPAAEDLFTYVRDKSLTESAATSILHQLLLGLQALHSRYGIVHADIKSDNILIKRVQPGGWLKYTVANDLINYTFYVANTGYIPMIADFGISQSLGPKHTPNGYTGMRNFKVYRDKCKRLLLKPIKCKYDSQGGTDLKQITWDDGEITTENITYATTPVSRMMPSIPIDLNDFVRFPPQEFHYDIIDTIHMFSGGYSTRQAGKHHDIKGVPEKMKDMLNALVPERTFKYDVDNVKSVIAAVMLKHIYVDKRIPPTDIVASYVSI